MASADLLSPLHFELGPPEATGSRAGARLDSTDPLAVLDHGKSDAAPRQAPELEVPADGALVRAPLQGTVVSVDVSDQELERRRANWSEYHETEVADRFETHGSPYVGHSFRVDDKVADTQEGTKEDVEKGAVLQGTGCCAGRVTAKALLDTDPRAVTDLEGRILVAERTDPGWTPLFPLAAGILVERGSLLSHSAIVARELGIPAVVAVRGLMSRVRSGDLVTFDGSTGEIRVVPKEEEAIHEHHYEKI